MPKHRDKILPNQPMAPGNTPVQGRLHPVTPQHAKLIINGRVIKASVHILKKSPNKTLLGSLAAAPLGSTDVAPIPPFIPELAAALGPDVDAIYQYVANNIDFLAMYGSQKGAVQCLIDEQGNSFDQAALMVALLRENGFTAHFMSGQLKITPEQAAGWLGTDPGDPWSSSNLLANGAIPTDVISVDSDRFVTLSHCWVKVDITGSGDWYVFDPAMKTCAATTGIDLKAATGYDQEALEAAVLSGANVASDYFQNLNTANLKTELDTMSDNLRGWMATNDPDATLDDVLGSRKIVPVTDTVRNTTLPYEDTSVTPDEWTDIPDQYKTTLRIVYDTIDKTFFSEDLAAKRLTITFNGSLEGELRLDGELIATSSAQEVGTYLSVMFEVKHPYAQPLHDQSFWQGPLWAGYPYLLGQSWGNSSPQMAYIHQQYLSNNLMAGGADLDENVIGQTLNTLFHTWSAQKSIMADIIGRVNGTVTVLHHQLGIVGHFDTPFMNLGGIVWSTSALDNDYSKVTHSDTALALRGVGFESNSINQLPNISAVSANTILNVANSTGQKIYLTNSSNWVTVRTALINYDKQTLDDIETWQINAGRTVMIHENGLTDQNAYQGYGYYGIYPDGGCVGIINGGLHGGGGDTFQSPGDTNGNTAVNQLPADNLNKVTVDYEVDQLNGDFIYEHTDISVGSQPFPAGLHFTRYYNSKFRAEVSNLGQGWKHNFLITAVEGNGAFDALLKEFAANVTHTLVVLEQQKNADNLVVGFAFNSLSVDYISKHLTSNIVDVSDGKSKYRFTQVSDGGGVRVYVPPRGVSLGLSLVAGPPSFYTMEAFDGTKWTFDSTQVCTKIEYPQGVTLTLNYSTPAPGIGHRITSVVSSAGPSMIFAYDDSLGQNWLESLTVGGRTTKYSVDTNANLVSFDDALVQRTSYEYETASATNHALKKVIMPGNRILSNVFDSACRVIEQTSPAGTTLFTYAGKLTIASHGDNINGFRLIQTTYNDKGLVESNNENGLITWHLYDGLDRVLSTTFPSGNFVLFEYDDYNRVIQKTYSNRGGSPITEHWGYAGIINSWTSHTDRNGNTWSRILNTWGAPTSETAPDLGGGVHPIKRWSYGACGVVSRFTDETGIITSYTVLTNGDVTQEVHDSGIGRLNLTTNYGYNAVGDRTSIEDPNKNTTIFEFDSLRRMTKKTDPSPFSYQTKFTFDEVGNLTKTERETDTSGVWQTESRTYSLSNKLLTFTDPLNKLTKHEYDFLDRLKKTTDAENRMTQFRYDLNMRLTKIIDPMNGEEDRTYTPNGLLASISDPNLNETIFEYDDLDRKIKTTYPDSTFEQWTLDGNGNATNFRTRNSVNIVQKFDTVNRLTSRTPGNQPEVRYTFDLAGRILNVETDLVSGNPATGIFSRSYDTAGRLTAETNPQSQSIGYELDANGNTSKITYPGGYYVRRFFDGLNRLTDIKLNGASTAAASFDYDKLSRRTQLRYGNGVVTSYSHDIGNNLTEVGILFAGAVNPKWSYGYNNVHQMTSQSVSDSSFLWHPSETGTTAYGAANDLNQYPTVGESSYLYNTDGCLIDDGTWIFSHDVDNRLTSATNEATNVDFDYDGFHRQIRKKVGSAQTKYIYSGSQMFEEWENVAGTMFMRYVYAHGDDDLICQIDASGRVTYLHQDHIGSIIAKSDAAGVKTATYRYSPFGEPDPSPLTGITFGFTGQRYDSEMGLYHYKARYYDASIGRFLQPDPAGYDVGNNLYPYAKNDPLNHTDPDGAEPIVRKPLKTFEERAATYGPVPPGLTLDQVHKMIDRLRSDFKRASESHLEEGRALKDINQPMGKDSLGFHDPRRDKSTYWKSIDFNSSLMKSGAVTDVTMTHIGVNPDKIQAAVTLGKSQWTGHNPGFATSDYAGADTNKYRIWTINASKNIFMYDSARADLVEWTFSNHYGKPNLIKP